MHRFASFIALSILTGCDIMNRTETVDAYLSELENLPARAIEPLPEFRPSSIFVYSSSQLPDPFRPDRTLSADPLHNGSGFDSGRIREYLEQFELEALEMVGSLSDSRRTLAIVRAGETLHPVGLGQYLGKHHGKVIAIDEAQMEILEIVPDPLGGWTERPRTLLLKNRS